MRQQTLQPAEIRATAAPAAVSLNTVAPSPVASASPSPTPSPSPTFPPRQQPSAIPTTPGPSPTAAATVTASASPSATATAGTGTPGALERPPSLLGYTGEVGQLEAGQGLIVFLRRQQGQRVWLDIRFPAGQFRGRLIGTDRHVLIYDDCPGRATLPEGDLSECTGVQLELPPANSGTLHFARDGDDVILRGVVRVGMFAGPLYGIWSVELAG